MVDVWKQALGISAAQNDVDFLVQDLFHALVKFMQAGSVNCKKALAVCFFPSTIMVVGPPHTLYSISKC